MPWLRLFLMGVTLSSVVTKSSAVFCGFNALCLHFSFSLGDLIALPRCHHKYFGLWSSCLQSICARSQYKNSFSAQLGFWPQSCFASNPCWLMNTCVPPVMGPCVEAQWGRLLPYCLRPLWRSWCASGWRGVGTSAECGLEMRIYAVMIFFPVFVCAIPRMHDPRRGPGRPVAPARSGL